MIRALVALSLVASSVAFVVPATRGAAARSVSMSSEMSASVPFLKKPANLDGSLAGDVGFDPLGLSDVSEVGIDLYWFREAELKHGRIAMMAFLGAIFTETFGPLPGMPTAGCAVDQFWKVYEEKPGAIFAMVIAISILEAISGVAITKGRELGVRAPGDYSFNPARLALTKETRAELELKEVKNGRLAMWAAAGMLMQESITHEGLIANFNAAFQ
eukprot:CAMPEP_0198420886 /NCGR_PEP_ID=MMETSP1452-20131203/1239_1 /TAXON_ID=1181717 /ORGANISM="Synchroma pusillum, Strain CCMP3072" /LENGTH=215 /DNA_ID=CAMNT_0044141067 /DNA_START=53 /DNA_END=700 /DNA_ORIENTATION=+